MQQAMVDHHGSQCGFCTPGIVMSLWCMDEHACATGTVPTRGDIADGLAGNLCRCTGYRPILDAAEEAIVRSAPHPSSLDAGPILAGLAEVPADDVLDYRVRRHRPSSPRSPSRASSRRWPARPDARVLAGGSDLVLGVNQLRTEASSIVWTGRVRGLADIVGDRHAPA